MVLFILFSLILGTFQWPLFVHRSLRSQVFSAVQLLDALAYLRPLYQPEVRGSRRKRAQAPECNENQKPRPHHDSEGHVIPSDAFERSYAMRWLTALLAQLEIWQELSHSGDVSLDDVAKPVPAFAHTEVLFQHAASLLAICVGFAATGKITRNFTFDSQRRVEIQLTDISLDNDDYGSVGAQTWGGACVLADMIVEDPERFGLDLSSGDAGSRRLISSNLGAGTGLVNLVVAKLLHILPYLIIARFLWSLVQREVWDGGSFSRGQEVDTNYGLILTLLFKVIMQLVCAG